MAQADNLLLIYRNWVDSSTLTGSGTATAYSRVQEMRPSRVCVFTSSSTAFLAGDVGASVESNIAAILAHNFDTSTQLRLRLGTDAGLLTTGPDESPDAPGIVYDSGWFDAWPPVAGLGYDGLGNSLGGYPILSDFADYRPYSIKVLDQTYTYRYWRIDIENEGSPGNSFGSFTVGRVMIGLALQTQVNVAKDFSLDWEDPSESVDTETSLVIRQKQKYRILSVSWDVISEGEMWGPFDDFKRIVGQSKDILIIVFPTGAQNIQYRTCLHGVPRQNGAVIRNPETAEEIFASDLVVRELAR